MAQRIVDTYISSTGGPQVIYTSEPQRKALAAAMERLWGKAPQFYKGVTLNKPGISLRDGKLENRRRGGQTTSATVDLQSFAAKRLDDGEQGGGNERGKVKRAIGGSPSKTDGGEFLQIVRNSAGEGHLGVDVVEGGRRTPDNLFGKKFKAGKPENSAQDDSAWNHSDCCSIQSGDDDADDLKDVNAAHSQTLFDAILDQNAIPTMRQNSECRSGLLIAMMASVSRKSHDIFCRHRHVKDFTILVATVCIRHSPMQRIVELPIHIAT